MPSEQLAAATIDIHHHPQEIQAKVCSTCHSALDAAAPFFLSEPLVCTLCRDRIPQAFLPDHRQFRIDQDASYFVRSLSSHDITVQTSTRRSQQDLIAQSPPFDDRLSSSSSSSSSSTSEPINEYHPASISSTPYAKKPILAHLTIASAPAAVRHDHVFSPPASYDVAPARQQEQIQQQQQTTVDPLIDITRLRIRSRAHHCLYPGATFQGTQKSGRNSYDVNVTIVDVNFASSILCGYLRIRGLTDDWPELTTYFDAEIIGNRYGFLTQNWGASQNEDMVHWSRFPAFKHIRHEAKLPHMTLDDRDRGVVFMRWKERFLVPDHRVQDINGASFAGFYYVCVDFNPPSSSSSSEDDDSALEIPEIPESEDAHPLVQRISVRTKSRSRTRRDSSIRRRGPSVVPTIPPTPTMTGFYYHQNSEPYQQLSLSYVPETMNSSFEFR